MSESSSESEWGPNPFVLNETSAITSAIEILAATLESKNADYKIDDEFSNFTFAADAAGIKPSDVLMGQIGIKIGRIKGLKKDPFKDINYEALLDSYQDLAGYAIILYAMKLKDLGNDQS